MLKFFLVGIMRGSELGEGFSPQDYRAELREMIRKNVRNSEIYDPLEGCGIQESNEISFKLGRKAYFDEALEVRNCDVMVAYLPEASMGTAIEMWEAYRHSIYIISITRMRENWSIRYLSDRVYGSLEHFNFILQSGEIPRLVSEFQNNVAVRYLWDKI